MSRDVHRVNSTGCATTYLMVKQTRLRDDTPSAHGLLETKMLVGVINRLIFVLLGCVWMPTQFPFHN